MGKYIKFFYFFYRKRISNLKVLWTQDSLFSKSVETKRFCRSCVRGFEPRKMEGKWRENGGKIEGNACDNPFNNPYYYSLQVIYRISFAYPVCLPCSFATHICPACLLHALATSLLAHACPWFYFLLIKPSRLSWGDKVEAIKLRQLSRLKSKI